MRFTDMLTKRISAELIRHFPTNPFLTLFSPTVSDYLVFFRRTLGTILGSKRMKNARFEQFGGKFEVV